MRYREVLTFPIALRRETTQSLRDQITEQIAAAVDAGTAQQGARVPSTRTLAELLGVSRGVVGDAYDLLHSKGYLVTRPGSGTFIRLASIQPIRSGATVDGTPQWVVDFSPHQLCGEAFPIRAWRAAWRYASHQVPAPVAPPALGMPVLRRAIIEHLAQTRGIVAPDHDLVVTPGTAAGLRLVLEALGEPVAVEGPMSPDLLRAAGAHVPLPASFLDVPSGIGAAVVCPDGNRPLGTVMTARQRVCAVEWSRSGGALIEVARDAVFQQAAWGLPRLLQPGTRTVIVGGFCEVLTPTLKLGYALVPKDLAHPIGALITDRGDQPPDLTQLVVAQLLTEGTMVRQMHRLTHLYAAKRAIVAEVLAHESAEEGTALVRFPDAAAPERLRQRGIKLPTLDSYGSAEPALVIGFGHLPDKALRKALDHLVSSLR
jgi:GntR family transcriptional regulator/MocR family aminotransferase